MRLAQHKVNDIRLLPTELVVIVVQDSTTFLDKIPKRVSLSVLISDIKTKPTTLRDYESALVAKVKHF
jgi:hypothetical protein